MYEKKGDIKSDKSFSSIKSKQHINISSTRKQNQPR